jgi:hypothetical protein
MSMLSMNRFKALADAYGGDLRRWPEESRAEAQALAEASPGARALLEEARRLDEGLSSLSARRQAADWPAGTQEAALARLRAGVEGRLPMAPPADARRGGADWFSLPRARWLGLATAGGFALVAGFFIGSIPDAAPSDSMLTLLLPTPFHLLVD